MLYGEPEKWFSQRGFMKKNMIFLSILILLSATNIWSQENNDIYQNITFTIKDDLGNENVVINGDDIKSIYKSYDQFSGIGIVFKFNDTGTEKLASVTENNIYNEMHIYLNDELLVSANILEKIPTGEVALSGVDVEFINALVVQNILPAEDLEPNEKIANPIIINLDNMDLINDYENTPLSVAQYFLASVMRKDDLYKNVIIDNEDAM
jgi:hypothetical protein